MLLALNVGNTHTGFGVFDSEFNLLDSGKRPTYPLPTSESDLLNALGSILKGGDSVTSVEIAASSVVPQFTELLRTRPSITLLDCDSPYSFTIPSETRRAGTDRLANAEACSQLLGTPCIVVDAGTATSFSVVARTHSASPPVFLGGAISAGLGLSIQALTQNAAQIPSFELQPPSCVIGRNTHDALLSGSVLGHALMIDSLVVEMKQELKNKYEISEEPKVALTGGLSSLLLPLIREVNYHDPFLTLRGIAYVHDRVRKRKPQIHSSE